MIIFRCNASPVVGFGHLMRCRSLAIALKQLGQDSIMVGPLTEYATPGDDHLFRQWIPRPVWSSAKADAEYLVELAQETGSSVAVLDDYRVDQVYQLVLKGVGIRWLQFDRGFKQPLWADIVVNASPAAEAEHYRGVVQNPDARLLLGPKYAILRPEFPPKALTSVRSHVRNVLVTFGGGDDRGAIIFVLSTLLPVTAQSVRFLVMSGKHNPRNAEIQDWIADYGGDRVDLHINPPSVAELMVKCDIAVMAGGTTTYEAACCGLPMILMAIADNQIRQSKGWEKIGVAKYLGSFINQLLDSLPVCFRNLVKPEELSTMRRKAYKTVDGAGFSRVSHEIIKFC